VLEEAIQKVSDEVEQIKERIRKKKEGSVIES
jgi:hypothetical protein